MPTSEGNAPLRGDEDELFRAHHDHLLRLVERDTGAPPQVAEDACCFAWLQLCRSQPDRDRVVGWLRVVARHEAWRLMRRSGNTVPLEAAAGRATDEGERGPTLAELLAGDQDVEKSLEVREALRALADLRWRRRRVMVLRAAGYSYKEIASLLGVTYTNVNRHVTEGRAELRDRIAA